VSRVAVERMYEYAGALGAAALVVPHPRGATAASVGGRA